MAALETIECLQREALADLDSVGTSAELEDWQHKYLGRSGRLTLFMRGIGALGAEERPAAGRRANELRRLLEVRYDEREERLNQSELASALEREALDGTLPGRRPNVGRLHPLTQTRRRITSIFAEMGFQVYNSREVESDLFNFELLNIPRHHPARDMWDTFYLSDSVVLRTHTSPGQIHVMRERCPEPIRVILPGKCYRYEQVSVRHDFQFQQVEGLAVGRGITLADLKGVLQAFTKRLYGEGREMRLRGGYFPFTEPSVEVDLDCAICEGDGCRVCKQSGWVEIAGAGMVHPAVLRNGGYDPAQYSGFAFGMAVERQAMLLHAIDDIRHFYANDLRFLRQFHGSG